MEEHKQIELDVVGMHCTNCAEGVRRMMVRNGAEEVEVDYATNKLRYVAKNGLSESTVTQEIQKLGYKVVQKEAEEAQGLDSHNNDGLDIALWICIALTAPMLILHLLMPFGVHVAFMHNPWVQAAMSTPVYLYGAWYFGKSAWGSLMNRYPNMDVLIFVSSTSAMVYSVLAMWRGDTSLLLFETAASIVTLVLLGNYIEHRAIKKTTSAIDELERLQPAFAQQIMADGSFRKVSVASILVGERLHVALGDVVPLDSVIEKGDAEVDESMLTGESLPVSRNVGDTVLAGSVLQSGQLEIRVQATGAQSFVQQMVKLVRQAQREQPPIQRLADKISAIFVPAVMIIALATFVLTVFVFGNPIVVGIMRMVAVLAISCPCAMGLATPMAIAVGVGRLARKGVLIKGNQTLERLARIRRVVFDKTGTLTEGSIHVDAFEVLDPTYSSEVLKSVAASLANTSTHPISKAVAKISEASKGLKEIVELQGKGIEGLDNEQNKWQLGSRAWLRAPEGFDLYLASDGRVVAGLRLSDTLRAQSKQSVRELQSLGQQVSLLSGDHARKVSDMAAQLQISDFYAEQSPEQKLSYINTWQAKTPTLMVGDGVNDAPSLAAAEVGVSMGQGTKVAIQSAQVVLLREDVGLVPETIRVGQLTVKTIRENLFWALSYNVIAIPIAALGYLNPLWAALFMSLSDVVIFVNSLRLRYRK